MPLNEIAFVVLVGSTFFLFVGLHGLFTALMESLFDRKRKLHNIADIKKTATITVIAFAVSFLAWHFI